MDFTPLRNYLRQMPERGVPGCELAVCRDHEILFHEWVGFSDEARQKPASPADRYFLYSCTKPVTATAAMIALEENLFGLDDPVSRYLPAFADAFVLKDGVRTPVSRPITVRHLLTMTAGLDYNLDCDSVRRVLKRTDGQATTVEIAEAMAEKPLSFQPGERFQYSLCHDVLAAVIEAVSGDTYGAFVQSRILDPLGMKDTDFYLDGKPADVAALYSYDKNTGRIVPQEKKVRLVPSARYYSGGAGLVSTATDYLKFADALACGSAILSREKIDLMRTEQMRAFHVEGSFSCTCGEDYGYGLGVRTRISNRHGLPSAFGEFGWDGAAGADILIDPEHRLSMVYVQHVLNWPDLLGCVHLQIRDLLYPILGL